MERHAIICGGSIGGLFAAAALRRRGWVVDIYERSDVELSGRGAGIVTHPELIAALTAVGADTADLGVPITERAAYDRDGNMIALLEFEQIVTSWDRMHQGLRALLPDAHQHLGKRVTGYAQTANAAEVIFSDGSRAGADLVIGADGFRSAIRQQMLPDIQPEYSGYLVWRALADEADLSADVRAGVFGQFGFYLPTGLEIIGYPIAGQDNDLRPGHRRYNFVWYANFDQAELDHMLVDANGKRHRLTIPPPLIRDDLLAKLYKDAGTELPDAFAEILLRSARPFFTPIYDHLSPVMAQGRVALLGDAACVARPHVGMGVTKAAEDALVLADCLDKADVPEALAAYSAQRLPAARAAYEFARHLGSHMSEEPEGGNPDGRSNPHLDEILRLTAVADFSNAGRIVPDCDA